MPPTPRNLDPEKSILYGMTGLVGCADLEFEQRLARSFDDTTFVSRAITRRIALNDLDGFRTPHEYAFDTVTDVDALMLEKAQAELRDRYDVVLSSFYNTVESRRLVGEVAIGSNALFVVLDFLGTPTSTLRSRRREWRRTDQTIDLNDNPNFSFNHGVVQIPSYEEPIDLIIELDGTHDIEELVATVEGNLEDHNMNGF